MYLLDTNLKPQSRESTWLPYFFLCERYSAPEYYKIVAKSHLFNIIASVEQQLFKSSFVTNYLCAVCIPLCILSDHGFGFQKVGQVAFAVLINFPCC